MGKHDRVDFNNISNDALKLLSDANKSIRDLAEYERTKPGIAKDYYYEVNEKCMNIIYSMIDEKDKLTGDIYSFDEISFLRNIGIIDGESHKLKKSSKEKVKQFCANMRYSTRDAITKILVIKMALLKTGCIVEDERTCILHRKYDEEPIKDIVTRKMRERPIDYLIYQTPDSNAVPEELSRKGRPGSATNPLIGGGWSPR